MHKNDLLKVYWKLIFICFNPGTNGRDGRDGAKGRKGNYAL